MTASEPRSSAGVGVGDAIPTLTLPITASRVRQAAAATWDWFPGHHDPDYARAQGIDQIYVNAMFLQGLLDRTALEWAGPSSTVRRRGLRMRAPLVAGSVASVRGRVAAVSQSDRTVELDLTVESEDGTVHALGEVTVVVDPAVIRA